MPELKGKTIIDEDDNEITLKTKFEVCHRCHGKGTHVNEAIDGNGLTREDIDELGGDDFMEDYMSGVYDVRCEYCSGTGLEEVVDEDRNTKEHLQLWYQWEQDRYESERISAMERRMGA